MAENDVQSMTGTYCYTIHRLAATNSQREHHHPREVFLLLHRQNNAELRFAARHARVRLGCLFERISFNHGTHSAQFGEAQCVLGIGWRSRGPALNRSTSIDELYRCDLNRIEGRNDHYELAIRPQAVDQFGHGFRARGCRYNHACAAQLLQSLYRVDRRAVDVYVRSKFRCQPRIFRPAPDRHDVITKLVRELNSEVAQTAD